jgi:hypothetical protein
VRGCRRCHGREFTEAVVRPRELGGFAVLMRCVNCKEREQVAIYWDKSLAQPLLHVFNHKRK